MKALDQLAPVLIAIDIALILALARTTWLHVRQHRDEAEIDAITARLDGPYQHNGKVVELDLD